MQKIKLLIPLLAGDCRQLVSLVMGITLSSLGASASARVISRSLQDPPATYYGPVLADPGFTPTAGMSVTAWIDGNLCGQSETLEVSGQIVYTINVLPEGPGGAVGCGAPGRVVSFQVGSQVMVSTVRWDNSQVWERPLLRCCYFDDDPKVSIGDIQPIANHWRCKCGDACYDPLYDLDGDCDIDIVDIMLVVKHWGKTCK